MPVYTIKFAWNLLHSLIAVEFAYCASVLAACVHLPIVQYCCSKASSVQRCYWYDMSVEIFSPYRTMFHVKPFSKDLPITIATYQDTNKNLPSELSEVNHSVLGIYRKSLSGYCFLLHPFTHPLIPTSHPHTAPQTYILPHSLYARTHTHVRMRARTHAPTHTRTHTRTNTHTHTRTHTRTHQHTNTNTNTNTNTHTHTHTLSTGVVRRT